MSDREAQVDSLLAKLREAMLSAVDYDYSMRRPTIRTGYERDENGEKMALFALGPVSVHVFTITHV